jgi:hypothetical protein
MGRHRADDDGARTLELGKLVAGSPGGEPSTDVVMEAAWEGERRRGGCFLTLAFVLCVLLAAGLGWVWRNAGESDPPPSSPAAVETVTEAASPAPTVTEAASPAPTVTRWRTRPPAAGKAPEPTPVPGPTVTRWRTRAPSPAPAPTVTVFKTRILTPQEENDDPQIPGSPDPWD